MNDPFYVLCKEGPWSHDFASMVKVIGINKKDSDAANPVYHVEDVMTRERYSVDSWQLDFSARFNEMEVIAWAATK